MPVLRELTDGFYAMRAGSARKRSETVGVVRLTSDSAGFFSRRRSMKEAVQAWTLVNMGTLVLTDVVLEARSKVKMELQTAEPAS